MSKFGKLIFLLLAVAAAAPSATWDTSGNGMLSGTYYFREVFYALADTAGDLNEATALYGTITFSGTGTYTMNATYADSSVGLGSLSTSGTYSIAASGHGFLSNPLSSGDSIYGLVSQQGIFVGSSTENGSFNDIFVAAPVATPLPSTGSFSGSYTFADLDLSNGSPFYAISSMFSVTADGAGNLGTVTPTGYVGISGTNLNSQVSTSMKYTFSNGAAVVNFPNAGTLIAGQKYLYFSKDGNFVFGGSPLSYDIIIGVKTGVGTPSLSGLYYQAGIDEDDSQLAAGYGLLDTYYGALTAGNGKIIAHQRVDDILFNPTSSDYTYTDSYNLQSDGTYKTTWARYVVGAGGAVRIGSGIGPLLGINVALQAPTLSGTGVYLSPVGVVNSGSSAPFTAGIAPGELLTLYGSNLAGSTQVASIPFPTILGSVQVTIGGLPAAIYYVSSTQISAIVPYGVPAGIAEIQVTNNAAVSNTVTVYVGQTAPGVFTQDQNGLGYAAIRHADATASVVTSANPAQMGETVSVYLTGLGAVTPPIADGAPGSADPTALNVVPAGSILAYVGGVQATVSYAGLAPQLSGLYQLNITIPTGLTVGDNYLDVAGPDSYTHQSQIPIAAATSSTAGVETSSAVRVPQKRAAKIPNRLPCALGKNCGK